MHRIRLPAIFIIAVSASLGASTAQAQAQAPAEAFGAPIMLDEGVVLDPLFAARLRHESVDQEGLPDKAEAVTLRARAGAELRADDFSVLVEGEGTFALAQDYNDTLPGNGLEPFPVVADPENLELNRFQVSWTGRHGGITVGRQRIVFDNARFVGNVGWRQNEQTFDAVRGQVRGQVRAGAASFDAVWSGSQRTVFGADSPNAHYDGEFVLLNGGIDGAAVDAKAFAYLIDYDTRAAFSSQTYGILISGQVPLGTAAKLSALASYASQRDHGSNPVRYRADYWNGQLTLALFGFAVTAGYEELGSDRGTASFQTPLATLHAFNGWADLFLTTPASGLRDRYAGIGRAIELPWLPGLRAEITYHAFDSAFGETDFGREWDASLGFRLGVVGVLAKYANYDARGFATDTEKLWLQAEIAF